MEKFKIEKFVKGENYVLEASAGTGKTYNIVQIVEKLVKQYEIPLEKILIVTFTEKAAGELKNRIREKLPNHDCDKAHIGTIHSFCKDMLSEFALSAKQPMALEVIDEGEVEDFIVSYLRCGNILNDIIKIKNDNSEFKIDGLVKKFKAAIDKYYLDKNHHHVKEIVEIDKADKLSSIALEGFLNKKTSEELFAELYNEFEDIKKNYNILLNSEENKEKEFVVEINNVAANKFYFDGSRFQARYFHSNTSKEAFEYFKNLKGKLAKYDVGNVLVIKYLDDLYQKWQEYKLKNKSQTFNDMVRNVRENVLNNDTFKRKLKEKFTYAIIDEFQDTNQIQFDIFKELFMHDDDNDKQHNIIVVGDPKQSIYSFQGADINVYYKAVKEIGEKNCYILDKNYRSSAPMVDTCNKLFANYDFGGTEFKPSEYLDAKNIDEKGQPEKEVKAYYDEKECKAFWIATKDNESEINSKEFAQMAVEQIIDCCSVDNGKSKLQLQGYDSEGEKVFRNVSFKDFAVLARAKSEMVEIIEALKRAGIPYVKYKDLDLFLGRECAHWIALLEAIDAVDFTGQNRSKFKKALFTNFFGYELMDICNPKFDSDDNLEMEQINKWRILAAQEKWEYLFDDIVVNSKLLTMMSSLKDKQSLAKFKQISEYCIDYLSNGHSLSDLIRVLKKNNKNDDDEDGESAIIKKNTDFDSVQVMTIHASKGLEFPVVIAAGGFKKLKNSDSIYIRRTDDNSFKCLTFNKPNNFQIDRTEELKRLYYVAYTRAKYILILPKYVEFTDNFLKNSLNKLLDEHHNDIRIINPLKAINLKEKVQEILKQNKNKEVESSTEDKQKEVLKELIKNEHRKASYKHSYSSLSHSKQNESEKLIDENGVGIENDELLDGLAEYDRLGKEIFGSFDVNKSGTSLPVDFPKGTLIGTALHRIFELIDYRNHNENIDDVIKKSFKSSGVTIKNEWLEPIKNMVENILMAKLPIIHGSEVISEYIQLKDISHEDKNTEVEFIFNKDKEKLKNYFNGFVDLIFRKDDYYAIVDWKTDSLNDNFASYVDERELKKHVDEKYSVQRTLYAYCLIKWLKLHMNKDEDEIFNKHFGGVYYVFMRGCDANTSNGIYGHSWGSYHDLEESFNEIVKELM